MIKVGSSYIRKFQFFDEINDVEPPPNSKSLKNSVNENEEKNEENSSITISNISISDPKQMKIFQNKIFINGRATHKRIGQMVRENLIMKIDDNKIIDEYFIFNLVYYDFTLKIFEGKPYFIFLGSGYNNDLQKFPITKIKIYDGKDFIDDNKIKVTPGYEKGIEPFPQAFIKEIKLLKKIDTGKLYSTEDEENLLAFETLQNINAFVINDNFTYAAVSIDQGGIILIYGYPNLLQCETKDIIMNYLPEIIYNEKEVNVTNIQFSNIPKNENITIIILYVATGNSIYYYQWEHDSKKNSFPNNLKGEILNVE